MILRELQWAKVGWLFGSPPCSVPERKILLNKGKYFYIESFLQKQKDLIDCKSIFMSTLKIKRNI